MGFLDTLKKLGILKVGAEKAVYTKASERPESFMDEDFALSEKKKSLEGKPPVEGSAQK